MVCKSVRHIFGDGKQIRPTDQLWPTGNQMHSFISIRLRVTKLGRVSGVHKYSSVVISREVFSINPRAVNFGLLSMPRGVPAFMYIATDMAWVSSFILFVSFTRAHILVMNHCTNRTNKLGVAFAPITGHYNQLIVINQTNQLVSDTWPSHATMMSVTCHHTQHMNLFQDNVASLRTVFLATSCFLGVCLVVIICVCVFVLCVSVRMYHVCVPFIYV